ncbi:carotenoid biosynthesis protein [Actinokineospora sp. UTMC 2448]|uniref:carotenoid biosynthesis protein n=1 Tax=Actinokineospora sp. UTMC 2448 TaxID=2268449 RepID=UPI002164C09A|nr:carotenoid biosynthesis protein [Actinokineospora sp. UTMC 2448]UVS78479.1 carotene biosynthesis associated membrane protein [Actinokineospora sp. UTMC 2448]
MLSRMSVRAVPGFRTAAIAAWALGATAVVAQIVYSMTAPADRTAMTVLAVVAFAAASVLDAAARCGPRAAVALVAVAGGGGLAAEAVGVHTGFPFGDYAYTGSLGPALVGVPVLVPLAWIMMAWPAALVGRVLGRGWLAVPVAGWALASWDVFLDPQMVDAGHWVWADPTPALPGVAGVPLTNFAGWLLVATLISAGLVAVTRSDVQLRRGPAPVLYLWTYGSSVWAHAAFFDRPAVSLVGGLLMGVVAVPFAVALWRAHR